MPTLTFNASVCQAAAEDEDDEDAPLRMPSSFPVSAALKDEMRAKAEKESAPPHLSASQQPRPFPPFARPRPAQSSAAPAFTDTFVAPLHYKGSAQRLKEEAAISAASAPVSSKAHAPTSASGYALRFYAGPLPQSPPLHIPDVFTSLAQYQSVFTTALIQQLNASLAVVEKDFRSAIAQWRSQRESLSSSPSSLSAGRRFDGRELSKQQQRFFRSHKVQYYRSDALQIAAVADRAKRPWLPAAQFRKQQSEKQRSRQRGAQREDDADADADADDAADASDDEESGAECFWLILTDSSSREKQCAKDDLWVLSNQPLFGATGAASSLWVAFAIALWRGFSPDGGMLKVQLLGTQGRRATIKGKEPVFAIRGPNINTEARQPREACLVIAHSPLLSIPTSLTLSVCYRRPRAQPCCRRSRR